MKTLTLSAIVGGLILAGIIVTVHSCNSHGQKPVAKPSIDSVEVPQPQPDPVYPLSTPPAPVVTQTQPNSVPLPSPSPISSLSPTPPKQKPHTPQDRCFSVRVPASSDSAPTITPVPCK